MKIIKLDDRKFLMCPICEKDKNKKHKDTIYHMKHHSSGELSYYIENLLEKIHEKIEFYENLHPECNIYLENTILELKSLLK